MIEITDVAKEMSNKYHEDELKWVLMLRRLTQQGYGIYKIPSFETDSLKDTDKIVLNKNALVKEPLWLKEAIEREQDIKRKVLLVPLGDKNYVCPICGKKVIANSDGEVIQYRDVIYCFQCALPKIAEWNKQGGNS